MAALAEEGEPGRAIMDRLTADPLVEGLLLLHGLHPLDVDTRIQRALDQVRPYLGSHAGGVQYLGVTDGIARLRLEGSCHGCPSSTVTVRLAIEGAVQDAAPEVTEVRRGGDDRATRAEAAADRPRPRSAPGAGPPRQCARRRVGHAAGHRPAQFAAGDRSRGGPGGARLLGPRDPVRLPRRSARPAVPRWARGRSTVRCWPARAAAGTTSAGRARALTAWPPTSTRCRCWPTARACAWRCRRRCPRERARGPAPVRHRTTGPAWAGRRRSGRPGREPRRGHGGGPSRGHPRPPRKSASSARRASPPSTATSRTWSSPA